MQPREFIEDKIDREVFVKVKGQNGYRLAKDPNIVKANSTFAKLKAKRKSKKRAR